MSEKPLIVDKGGLAEIAQGCLAIADKLHEARSVHGGRYLGQTWRTDTGPSTEPAEQLLGTAEYPHSGRLAGQRLAEHISRGEAAMTAASETLQALAAAVLEVKADFEAEDLAERMSTLAEELRIPGVPK
ncbi:hypothetical protein LX16_2980 [Stackebrandtia albiflava]|uniref:Uncharacterized protein n=1 Tax=Stackebrandtia albiflava TaxID=406432 RepID=A0A562V2Z1_9ACTN|nr:hypothetical protein [Stackebrandtia albiflava]TWJ12225.1 hypothetical protein LX16_2980 [Stackebrandtia albiflava]